MQARMHIRAHSRTHIRSTCTRTHLARPHARTHTRARVRMHTHTWTTTLSATGDTQLRARTLRAVKFCWRKTIFAKRYPSGAFANRENCFDGANDFHQRNSEPANGFGDGRQNVAAAVTLSATRRLP
ncbi:hypothetical protein EVAR_50508_1 [Eumeta japonica]|uniref:Uncharacterized protein n=1 Tax=Eumeta variegata TaxID=151549 RepID=A0A4C1X527_EUMVA|nr:hypothetical protein EVAR_50508_1 [Eumeta japonica]